MPDSIQALLRHLPDATERQVVPFGTGKVPGCIHGHMEYIYIYIFVYDFLFLLGIASAWYSTQRISALLSSSCYRLDYAE